MSPKDQLIYETQEAPEPFLTEVLDFVYFRKTSIAREILEITFMSESSLSAAQP